MPFLRSGTSRGPSAVSFVRSGTPCEPSAMPNLRSVTGRRAVGQVRRDGGHAGQGIGQVPLPDLDGDASALQVGQRSGLRQEASAAKRPVFWDQARRA
jgi:hypothetical protein